MEHILVSKDACIFRIEAEHQTDTQFVEGFLRFWIIWVFVLGENLVVQHTDNLTRLDADLQLFFDMGIGIIHQKSQTMIILLQISQLNHLWCIVGVFHVMHFKSGEVASHNPTGRHRQGQSRCITTDLLVWRQLSSVALFGFGREVDMRAFLLNQDLGDSDIGIYEIRTFFLGDGFHRDFKLHPCHRVVDAEDIM